jgi:hypothetical protein
MRTKVIAGITALTFAASSVLAASCANARPWHHHGYGGAAFGFAAGALLGGALAAQGPYYYGPGYGYYGPVYYGPGPAYVGGGNEVAYCESRFKSYDPASGTYLGYDGNRHSCP